MTPLGELLLALAAVIAAGRVLSALFARIGQPPVIGEVVAGILLGPSLLGPEASARILPPAVAPLLGAVSQLGVVLYMFLVGLDLNPTELRKRLRNSIVVSLVGIGFPFLLGALLSIPLFDRYAPVGVPHASFTLFLGVAMSITAFPVLARILRDTGLDRTPLGALALSCAATDDAIAWCLLALVVGVAQARIDGALVVAGLSLGYAALMFAAVRPLAARLARRFEHGPVGQGAVAVVFLAVLISALATEWIGIHAIFGAFLLGAVLPHDSRLAREINRKVHDPIVVLFLPAFFAFTGMRTRIGLVTGAEDWLWCGAIVLVATLGKFGGTLAASRVLGLDWKTGTALGVLMNTRGLVELIVLNVGLELGVLSPALFAMLVLMALVTTAATAPVLRLVRGPEDRPPEPAAPLPAVVGQDQPGIVGGSDRAGVHGQ